MHERAAVKTFAPSRVRLAGRGSPSAIGALFTVTVHQDQCGSGADRGGPVRHLGDLARSLVEELVRQVRESASSRDLLPMRGWGWPVVLSACPRGAELGAVGEAEHQRCLRACRPRRTRSRCAIRLCAWDSSPLPQHAP